MIKPLKKPDYQDLKIAVIGNSQTLGVGDFVVPGTSGVATKNVFEATNTSPLLLGNVVSVVGKNGELLEKNSVAVGSDNQTVAQIKASYLPSYIPMEYLADLDDAAATTSGSDGIGFFTLVSGNGGLLDESSWVSYTTTPSQFVSFGVNPINAEQVFAHPFLTL